MSNNVIEAHLQSDFLYIAIYCTKENLIHTVPICEIICLHIKWLILKLSSIPIHIWVVVYTCLMGKLRLCVRRRSIDCLLLEIILLCEL